ncbi:hypothetical protein ACP3V7_24425, partial [Salmonella enterica]|uniref:hypothetical protein n=1 Tax=Salmonella enterica TaxID=28901 RepID=UPI003CF18748
PGFFLSGCREKTCSGKARDTAPSPDSFRSPQRLARQEPPVVHPVDGAKQIVRIAEKATGGGQKGLSLERSARDGAIGRHCFLARD